jgi:hypothetical protein
VQDDKDAGVVWLDCAPGQSYHMKQSLTRKCTEPISKEYNILKDCDDIVVIDMFDFATRSMKILILIK